MSKIKIFAPATVANVGPGYDILGFALSGIGDVLEMELNDSGIITITNSDPALPTDPAKNVAGIAAISLLKALNRKEGVDIKIKKQIASGSGMGSSASSSAGAVFGLNHLLNSPLETAELVEHAMQGELGSSGVAHADNVSPCLLGGFTLVRSYEPLDVIALPVPEGLYCTVIHPHIEVNTADSKRILKTEITLRTAVQQWGNVAGLVAGLYRNDLELLGRSIKDKVIEPTRSMLIPGYDELKNSALAAGAIGCSISGSGPSVFALSSNKLSAEKVKVAMEEAYHLIDINYDIYVSSISTTGCKLID